jgi:membrane protease subunit HflC
MKLGVPALVGLGALGALAAGAFYQVAQTQQALILRFGEPVRIVNDPGLHVKLPLIDTVVLVDNRILDLDVPGPLKPDGEEMITADQRADSSEQKRLAVDAFARYKIVDPLKFYQTVGSISGAENRLGAIVMSAARRVIGSSSFVDIVKNKRPVVTAEIAKEVDAEAKQFGVTVVDVRLRRVDLPAQASNAVFDRMKSQFVQQATDIRSQGQQASQEIRSKADREATIIRAEATKKADQIRGEGEGDRNRIFAEAYGRDADFFAFYRSMQAYESGLKPGTTRMLISPKSEFFRYFNSAQTPAPR